MSDDNDIQLFVRDRNEALLSMDLSIINAYLRKYKTMELPNNEIGWATVRKAISAIVDFPEEVRKKSRDWLIERGYTHFGDEI